MKKEKLFQILNLAVIVLGVVALIMSFVPAIKYGDNTYNAWKVMFGYTSKSSTSAGPFGTINTEFQMFKFSFMNLLSYLMVLGVVVVAVLSLLKENKIMNFVNLGLGVVGGVFLLLTKQFVVLGTDLKKLYDAAGTTFASDSSVSLGAGAIVAAVMLFIVAAVELGKVLLNTLKK